MRSIFPAIATACAIGFTPVSAMAESISTASEAVAYLLDNKLVPETDTTRVYEIAESIRPGIHRWRFTFLSEAHLTSIKINADLETEVLAQFDDPSSFSPSFVERIAEPRDIPIGQEFVEKARALVKSKYPANVIEPGHISLYKICLTPSDGKASKYSNGCRRKQPFEQWNVYLRVTPPSGDWFVKNVVFADELEPVVSDGPRGFFQ